jgi:hypothetical protein
VPTTALSSSGGDHVFAVAASGELRRLPATVVERNEREVVVLAPESVGQVVNSPAPELAEGVRVAGLVSPLPSP